MMIYLFKRRILIQFDCTSLLQQFQLLGAFNIIDPPLFEVGDLRINLLEYVFTMNHLHTLTHDFIQFCSNSNSSLLHFADADLPSLIASSIPCLSKQAKNLSRESQHTCRLDFSCISGLLS